MTTRIRTLNFLPEIFQTPTNSQFLRASLDQLVVQPESTQTEGFVGSKFGYGINAKDYYVTEPTKVRKDYQLDPGVIFTKPDESTAKDFISYPGIIDALKMDGGLVNNNDRLFQSQFYSWDSFSNLDKLINFNQYYWLPVGPAPVVVSTETVFNSNDYIVSDVENGYIVNTILGTGSSTVNPTLTLLRGGTYTFSVNQNSGFWIQGAPGVTGYSSTQPNLQTRDVLGVNNNGATQGVVTFTVPFKDAQSRYDLPGNISTGVVSSIPFSKINGAKVKGFAGIDGVTSLENLSVLFYNTGPIEDNGYVSNFFDSTPYDTNTGLVSPKTISIISTSSLGNLITCNSVADLVIGNTITFTGTPFGGLAEYSTVTPNTIYYITFIDSVNNKISISNSINGPAVSLSDASDSGGPLIGNINQGLYEEGFYSNVNDYLYKVTYVGDPADPIIKLLPLSLIPTNQKITAEYGTEWISRSFFKNSFGEIEIIPFLSAPLNTLYYQDSLITNKVGTIKLIDSNSINLLDIDSEILGKKRYTSDNGVIFTNGLKVSFQGEIFPEKYKTGFYYVEGVGTAIELIPTEDLVTPELFTVTTYIPWSSTPWDTASWEGDAYIPVEQDYITIARNSISKNAWSRSNRWFHIDVINATAKYNNNPQYASLVATQDNKAKRPIIEFYPNLTLFNSGTEGKAAVDFIDFRTADALSLVAGQQNYYPDIEVYTDYTATIASTNYTPTRNIISGNNVTGVFTTDSGYNTTGFRVNDLVVFDLITPNSGVIPDFPYYVSEIISSTEFTISATKGGEVLIPDLTITGPYQFTWSPLSTTFTVLASEVENSFELGYYVTDSTNVIPQNSQVVAVSGTTVLNVTIAWEDRSSYFASQSGSSIVASVAPVDGYALFDGARVLFAGDTSAEVKNKIYVARFSKVGNSIVPVITLTEADDGVVLPNQRTVAIRGYENQGTDFYFDGITWIKSQQKVTVNQAPLFDIFDKNNLSFGNTDVYTDSSFVGSKLFAYGLGSGVDDPILGFPIRYSSGETTGNISFDVSLNIDSFTYNSNNTLVTQLVNTGYVHNNTSRVEAERLLGWQTAVAPSAQYQVFEFEYDVLAPTGLFVCDIAANPIPNSEDLAWPTVQVYINNVLQGADRFVVAIDDVRNTTSVTLNSLPDINTVIQILILSDSVSNTAYYQVPINLSNNPLNEDITKVNVGDIRGQYQSIFYNNPNLTGELFGSNNYRDLGNLVPWGTSIIQNSAGLALPGAVLRTSNNNLFDSLTFNSREYVKFKTLLVDTVDDTEYSQRYDPATMLDDALDQIASTKTNDRPFFWSDMVPSKAAYITNTYSFANSLIGSIYPLSRVYDFASSNYYGVLVYLTRTISNIVTVTQLVKNQDYNVSQDSPTLTVTLGLLPNDVITIKEYNQTYGSYIPNTPTKLGLYPAFIPMVVLDANYKTPTYFIRGHDGSYNKLYGEYNPVTGRLVDFRDQVLLEYELRVYNNLKISSPIPVQEYEVLPGFFRETDYTYAEWLQLYETPFLNWIGQNRIDYKNQLYNKADEYTYNYRQSGNKIDKAAIQQGYWRGIYQYYYDTSTPDATPWEMLGYKNQPIWWETRYGAKPYTSDNLVLWNDLAQGIDWNGGNPVVIESAIRPELLKVLPVDSAGKLVSPFVAIVGNYDSNIFQRDWIVGDCSPAEFSYRRSSSYPFDLMKLLALSKPAKFFNLGVDLDNYKYNAEFNQYLVNDRSHLNIRNIEIYGSGISKASYLNWIVDYQKQVGSDGTENIAELLYNLDVRLVYRLAGFSDKNMLKFYVEKGSANSRNASLLIPDASYSVLLYENQPFAKVIYSGVIVQLTTSGYAVYGNSQTVSYFNILKPIINGNKDTITIENLEVDVYKNYSSDGLVIPYGTTFYTVQEVAQFLTGYGAYLDSVGLVFDELESGLQVDWSQMVSEFLYWAQTGWDLGSIVSLNPCANILKINKESSIVQPLTVAQTNFVLNENLYPIQSKDLSIVRDGTLFSVRPLNAGDTAAYAQFKISNFEHGIVFDNVTLFDDVIYSLVTGLRQNRIFLRGSKSAAWDGTVTAAGFIYNQDNINEWDKNSKYTKGQIVKYKNKYWTALQIVQPSNIFKELEWKRTEYDEIQKGLLPNSSTRSYESTLYYDINRANLENDADLLGFGLIGYRPRDYMALADLTDITQVNVYKNLIKNKGTLNSVNAFRGATLPQGGIDYELYENWAIKSGEFGGVLNNNFAEFKVNQDYLTGNPAIVEITNGEPLNGVQQAISLNSLVNYGSPIIDPDILPTISATTPSMLYPDAGYVNFNDVKMSSYFYSQLSTAVNKNNIVVPINDFYVRDYVWLANYLEKWQVYTPVSLGRVINVVNNLNNTVTVTFAKEHNLNTYQTFAIVNFDGAVDGYYIVTAIVNSQRVIINLSLDPNIRNLTGNGIGLKFQSQRVDQPSDVINLPLLDSEFIKNTVWVDTNNDGSWAVYRKGINYQYETEILSNGTLTFGSSVAYTDNLGYLIGDQSNGTVNRYVYNTITNAYDLVQVLTNDSSFGAAISYASNVFAISQPTNVTPNVFVYNLIVTDDYNGLVLHQPAILAPVGVTNWGSAVAVSGDTNWIFISDITNNSVHVYRKENIVTVSGNFTIGETYTIWLLGNTDFTLIGAVSNQPGVTFVATGVGSGTGVAYQSTYKQSYIIDGDALGLTTGTDEFGYAIATDHTGDTVVISAPNKNYSMTVDNWGYTFVFHRIVQNFETQITSTLTQPTIFQLTYDPVADGAIISTPVTATNSTNNRITVASSAGISVNDPVIFSGTTFTGSNIPPNVVFYVESVGTGYIRIKQSRQSTLPITIGTASGLSFSAYVQKTPYYVSVNGEVKQDGNYAIVDSTLVYTSALLAGDIVSISTNKFSRVQTLTTQTPPRIGVHFGYSLDTTSKASEILVGAPYELNATNQEGAVFRYTNAGGKYGLITGTDSCNVTVDRKLLINGYLVTIPAGNATTASAAINTANITNIAATATTDNKLVIQLIDLSLAQVNAKLEISTVDINTFTELGIYVYTQTQVINCPHTAGRTQFGTTVKFNEFDSFIVSAPVGTRFLATTFDFIDDELDNDTVFDNNSTKWVDDFTNAGAVYMFDYLANYNESLMNVGKFVYAQSTNALNIEYGDQPYYGAALDFNNNRVVVGTPDFRPGYDNGQVIAYVNETGIKDWSVYRASSAVVDINRINNAQLFSAQTNNTLINLDYIDPLQGKILGAARENIDVVTNVDPASYTSTLNKGRVWGSAQVGTIWFDTTNIRYVNYHQDNVSYNSQYWGTLFPGSDVAVYTWISSKVLPSEYQGSGTPYSPVYFSVENSVNDTGSTQSVYFYWVRNTNKVFSEYGKTLSDSVIESYITNPKNSGISYFTPILPNVVSLYNCADYINADDTVFHIGYATGENDDVDNNQYNLIRTNYASDFLPGLPSEVNGRRSTPYSLYNRLLDSLSGANELGNVVPDPTLPKAVQSGILARPRQSFFYNRLRALENYMSYANSVLAQDPITESKESAFSLLTESGESYDTTDYWEYINWWAAGYSDSTKASIQVSSYAMLSTLTVTSGTIVSVASNSNGKQETYVLTAEGSWFRIGLENGTIKVKSSLWASRLLPEQYPYKETRNIVRALTEYVYSDELLIHRNRSLILIFEYIQSETIENQNFAPWLNKTSLVDVSHTIRELLPYEVYKSDNNEFLSGYLNEVKPYHVVIKDFIFKYTKQDVYLGTITDFDLPAQYTNTINQFVSPQLVYDNASSEYQYPLNSDIWQNDLYNQWYSNYGLSIAGQPNVQITTLISYVTLNSSSIFLDNTHGLPINGVIKIDLEEIAYSVVNRATGELSGLTRGINGTAAATHLPGEDVYIDLPAVVVLSGGHSYTQPPKVFAYIDTTKYPVPRKLAILQAVMSFDSVSSVTVIDPGEGYSVLPEIRIDPALVVTFNSAEVNTLTNTIQLNVPSVMTGDLVQYTVPIESVTVGGLANNQWYYVGLLGSAPATVIALYASFADAYSDTNRVKFYDTGVGEQHLNLGAKATSVTSASPVRENNITLRFDRTSYNSKIIDWLPDEYYGSAYAGRYFNTESVSSSSILLDSTAPPVDSILASAQGVSFEVVDVRNDQTLVVSSFIRKVSNTYAANNAIRLIPQDGNNDPLTPEKFASGSTVGFYTGMPIKFSGFVIGGLISDILYYVKDILSDIDFTIADINGNVISLANDAVGDETLDCITAEFKNQAVVTVNYPGILTVTGTTAGVNTLTVPVTLIGSGGTNNFYTNLPIIFSSGVFGGVLENQVYYVTSVLDNQTFTMSYTENPDMYSATETIASSDTVVIDGTTVAMDLDEPIVFSGDVFGNISSSQIYYISEIVDNTSIKISTSIGGATYSLSDATGNMTLTSQKDVVSVSSESGSMVMEVSLPVSPGQVNGQKFTMYKTSQQYLGLTGAISNVINRNISSLRSGSNIVTLTTASGGSTNVYVGMPFEVSVGLGNLLPLTTYYVAATGTVTVTVTNTSANVLTCSSTDNLYIGMPVRFSGTGLGGIIIGIGYYVRGILSATQFTVSTSVLGDVTVLTTDNGVMIGTGDQYVQVENSRGSGIIDPGSTQQTATVSSASPAVITVATAPTDGTLVKFTSTDELPDGLLENAIYYVRNSSGGTFNVSLTDSGPLIDTTTIGTGIITVLELTTSVLTQVLLTLPVFDVSYILGGYRVLIINSGDGFAVDNVITISGADLGGTIPANNLTLTVNSIDNTGGILNVICAGTVASPNSSYYLKVISPTEFELYEDASMQISVNGLTLPYTGFSVDSVTGVTSVGNLITLSDVSKFNVNDPVVFTGDVQGNLNLGQTYYVLSVDTLNDTITVSLLPNSSVVDPGTGTGNWTIAKAGDYLLLPEPFTFVQSIVNYRNEAYICAVSNNDQTFVAGKWELIQAGDKRLNALDRINVYYQPTINMAGSDLTQLVSGITYSNPIYKGNAFAPDDQYIVDTLLQDQKFYPWQLDVTSVLWNGERYIAISNADSYSAILTKYTQPDWSIKKLAIYNNLNATYIGLHNGVYLITTNNAATPIYRSTDGLVWSTSGNYPNDTEPYLMTVDSTSLNAASYYNGIYVAVGENIVSSTDTYIWNQRFDFGNQLSNQFYDVDVAYLPSFNVLVAVGKGQTYTSPSTIVDCNTIATSTDGNTWNLLSPVTPKGMYSVANDSSKLISVGEDGIVYVSENGTNWYGVNESLVVGVNSSANLINVSSTVGLEVGDVVRFTTSFNVINSGTSYYVVNIISSTQLQVSTTVNGSPLTLTDFSPIVSTYVYLYPRTSTLRHVIYANNKFMAVGDSGLIRSSIDGYRWITLSSGTIENLTGVAYNDSDNVWIATGTNNTIILSVDNGFTWVLDSTIAIEPTLYDIEGSSFESGYAPEELVAGVVSDNLAMTVSTRPGTNWSPQVYQHVGYNVISKEYVPFNENQTVYSFTDLVQTPAQLSVYVIDGSTSLATRIYEPSYSVDWVNSTVTLASPLRYLPVTDSLQISVYEVGNGNQLVKASTKTDPIRVNQVTGWDEIYVNCNYSAYLFAGSGVIRPGTQPKNAIAIKTDSTFNTITVDSVKDFTLNDPITFQGAVFGGLQEDVTYYVKTVSAVSQEITVSNTIGSGTGVAGATYNVTDDVGYMTIVIQIGNGAVWTDPIVYHNGDKLILGTTGTVTRTNGTTNTITCNNTGALIAGTKIVFSNTMFSASGIEPQTVYYVKTIVDGNEFTVSEVPNGPVKIINTATGGASFVTNDYAIGIASNGISAKLIFAANYDNSVDYITYTLFGETEPDQYGYTIPETEMFIPDGVTNEFSLSNYVSGDNPLNAVVEINGLRIDDTEYVIDPLTKVITFNTAPLLNDTVAVTTYNLTENQYFNTQYGVTGVTLANIVNVDNEITNPSAILSVTATDGTTDIITGAITTGFSAGQTIEFRGTSFGGIATDGTVYYVRGIPAASFTIGASYTIASVGNTDFTLIGASANSVGLSFTATGVGTGTGEAFGSTEFRIADAAGAIINLTTSTGLIQAIMGGTPAIRITTGINHNLSTNDIVRIIGLTGSVQLNNNTYYVHVINPTQLDIYEQPYDTALGSVNYPVTQVSSYISGGVVSVADALPLVTAIGSETSIPNKITIPDTSMLIVGTPVYFTESNILNGDPITGGIIAGKEYFVSYVFNSTQFSISETRGGPDYSVTNDTGTFRVTQWQQSNVNRLWVTIDGYRVPTSKLIINSGNELGILVPIEPTQNVTITSMMPSATPNEEVYQLFVNKTNQATVYRANTKARTWLTEPLYNTHETIYVDDVSRITDTVIQNSITPNPENGVMVIGLNVNKRLFSGVLSIFNVNKGIFIDSVNYSTGLQNIAPVVRITTGSYISVGDNLIIYSIVGNTVYVNGEEIKFGAVDFANNTLTNLQRGVNGTAIQTFIPLYSEMFSLLPNNKLNQLDYAKTWNSYTYNAVEGDPLQISSTNPAIFLNQDQT